MVTPINRYFVRGRAAILCCAFGLWFVALLPNLQAQRTAKATAVLTNTSVAEILLADKGEGYFEPPVVTIFGGGGSGAAAKASISNGAVDTISILSGGTGYTTAPEVIISAPPMDPIALDVQMVPLLTIRGLPGNTNEIQFTRTMDGPVWIPLTNVVLTNTVMEWYDRISPAQAKGFYRTVLLGVGDQPMPGQRFVWLPPGEFLMGSPSTEQDRLADEGPQTRVTLTHGVYMGRYEVTQGEFFSVMNTNPSAFLGNLNRPVERVTWYEATNYCGLLTAKERTAGRLPSGWVYRLPTEAEWEYGCRAGTTNRFYWGADLTYTQLATHQWYTDNSGGTTHPVGQKPSNQWGLFDMCGNVWEWCSDWYSENHPGGAVSNPKGPASGSTGLLKGGAWFHSAIFCRSANRDSLFHPDRNTGVGFRVVIAPKE